MVNGSTNTALRQVARVFQEGTLIGLSDRQMLERFVDHRDETAFEVLVARHGPMVLNVCKQLLHNPHDAEDAFQAVFLVLVRKAGIIRVDGSLGPWLYTVTHRIAARARANRRRISLREVAAVADKVAASSPEDTLDRDESSRVIQEELARLPERLRAPLVLCYLEGMTHELAAGQLGCPVGTVRSRLSRGRAQLLRRISRRGLTLEAAGLVSVLESNSRAAALPPIVRITLIKLATEWASEAATTVGGLRGSVSVAALTEGVLNVMRIKKLAIVATGLVGMGALGLVIVDRAGAVGGPTVQESGSTSHDLFDRHVGPDGRPIGARIAAPQPEMVTRTYYVGDIIGVTLPPGPGSSSPEKTTRIASEASPKVDMHPLMNLISSTIAPRTWQIDNAVGQASDRKANRMVPFYVSISLIVRCPQEVHHQVGNLLRGLRGLLESRNSRTARPDPRVTRGAILPVNTEPLTPGQTPPPEAVVRDRQPAPLPLHDQSSPAKPPSMQRVQQLLDELQKEILKLQPTNSIDTRFAPAQ